MNIELGLVSGRHDLPVTQYIFNDDDIEFPINPIELQYRAGKKLESLGIGDGLYTNRYHHITVYVTGLTPATTAVIRVAFKKHIFLTLKHYDRDSGNWIDDDIFTSADDFSHVTVYPSWA